MRIIMNLPALKCGVSSIVEQVVLLPDILLDYTLLDSSNRVFEISARPEMPSGISLPVIRMLTKHFISRSPFQKPDGF